MELYYIIAITDHDRGEAMGSLYHAAGLHLILSMPARGTATSEHLAIYGLDATEKCVIAAVGSAQEADSLDRAAQERGRRQDTVLSHRRSQSRRSAEHEL